MRALSSNLALKLLQLLFRLHSVNLLEALVDLFLKCLKLVLQFLVLEQDFNRVVILLVGRLKLVDVDLATLQGCRVEDYVAQLSFEDETPHF